MPIRVFTSRKLAPGKGWVVIDFASGAVIAGPFKERGDGGRGRCLTVELHLRAEKRAKKKGGRP